MALDIQKDASGGIISQTHASVLDPAETLGTPQYNAAQQAVQPVPSTTPLIGQLPEFDDDTQDVDSLRTQIDADRNRMIAAIDTLYDREFAKQQEMQTQRLARQRVMNVRTGTTGSEIGESKTRQLEDLGSEERAVIAAKKSQAVSQALGQFRQEEADLLSKREERIAAREKRFFDRQKYFTGRAQETIAALATSGVDFETVRRDPNFEGLSQILGGENAVKGYYLASKPEQEKLYDTITEEGLYIALYQNPDGTRERVEFDLEIPKKELPPGFEIDQIKVDDDGTIAIIPKRFDPSLPYGGIQFIKGQFAGKKFAPKGSTRDEEEEGDLGGVKVSGVTMNVVEGNTKLGSITSNTSREKVKAELRELGFYDTTPPDWYKKAFREEFETSSSSTPTGALPLSRDVGEVASDDEIASMWNKERLEVINEEKPKKEEDEEDEDELSNEEFLAELRK